MRKRRKMRTSQREEKVQSAELKELHRETRQSIKKAARKQRKTTKRMRKMKARRTKKKVGPKMNHPVVQLEEHLEAEEEAEVEAPALARGEEDLQRTRTCLRFQAEEQEAVQAELQGLQPKEVETILINMRMEVHRPLTIVELKEPNCVIYEEAPGPLKKILKS